MKDLIIKNGTLYDGTGSVGIKKDMAIKNGKIVEIAERIEGKAREILDVEGLAVAPGFIDMHSHGDTTFLIDNRCEAKIYQGVTTEVAGQCGSTIYPCPQEKMKNLYNYTGISNHFDKKYYTSSGLHGFMEKACQNKAKMGTNLVSLIGHGALRAGVMGFEAREATTEELRQMCDLLEQEMKDGAWGISLGLGYTPGIFANQKELNALGQVISKYDGVITSHMRNQTEGIYEALEEMYEINRKTGARVHIAHLKLNGKVVWGQTDKLMNHIKIAQEQGIAVTADIYPYNASSTGLTNIFPKWALEGGIAKAAQRLRQDGEEKRKILAFLEKQLQTQEDGEGIRIVTTGGRYPQCEGKTLYAHSQELGNTMVETVEEIVKKCDGKADCIFFGMNIKDVHTLLKEDLVIGSDGSGYSYEEKYNDGRPHPRNFGTFPKFLRLVREERLCSLEKAVYRMTKKTASIVGIKDRGVLQEGMIADITIFDPKTVADRATFEDPFKKPIGIDYVIMNGEFAVYKGQQTEKRLGNFLLKR